MKSILNIFSWVSSALIEGLCPGNLLVNSVFEELQRYNESAEKIAGAMQNAWNESVKTLIVTLGGGEWLNPKSRKQIAERFAKDVITPFALQNKLSGAKLESFLEKARKQCEELESISSKVIDFTSFNEEALLQGLSDIGQIASSGYEIGEIIIEHIQNHQPSAKELLELLWYRNLLLEGLVTHFNLGLSRNSHLAALVGRMDRQRIQNDLADIKTQIDKTLQDGNFYELGKLGSRATQLSAAEELFRIDTAYRELTEPILKKLDELSEDHKEMNLKLDTILQLLMQLQNVQKTRIYNSKTPLSLPLRNPDFSEQQIVKQLSSLVEDVGWKALSVKDRTQTATCLALSLCSFDESSKSIQVLEDVIREGTSDPVIYSRYFEVLQAAGRDEEAVDAYKKAIELDPNLALFPPDKYEILAILGRGGMGVVYKAQCLERNIPVAIKVLILPEKWYGGARKRFLQAAEAASQLQHDTIVNIYGYAFSDIAPAWVVMEYLEGSDLQKYIEQSKPFGLKEGIQIAKTLAEGLIYAHDLGVVHRDLKPGNIMITPNGPKIIDFGVAKWERETTLTLAGESYYSLYYSAPEQKSNFDKVDQRSDIFSFGKTLYYLFTGEEPYDIDWDDLPEEIRPVLRKATRKTPEKRYQNVREMLQALEKVSVGEKIDASEEPESGFFPAFSIPTKKSKIPLSAIKKLSAEYMLQEDQIISLKDKAPMVYIPSGVFLMGDDSEDAEMEEEPIHKVYLDGYFMDVFPVTNEKYAVFLKALEDWGEHPSPWCHPAEPQGKVHIPQFWYNREWNQENYPVVGVDWWDAYAYSRWAGKSLPTEAEWEKAARGFQGYYYPWGNDPPTPDKCNFDKNVGRTTPVDKYLLNKSPYGCMDMVGNVWEWCYDLFDPLYYKQSPIHNPMGPVTGRCPVGRGGSWQKSSKRIRTTTRGYGNSPEDRHNQLGFRTVKRLATQ